MRCNPATLQITHPAESELETVLKFAFKHLSPSESAYRLESILQRHRAGQVDLTGIFLAKHENTLAGAMYVQSRPDGSVMFWVPTMAEGFSLEPMLEPLIQFCQKKKAYAAVAMADRNQPFDEQTFCSAGQFRFLSELIYLAAEILPNELPQVPPKGKNPLKFMPILGYSDEVADRLTRLVKRTYQHSLDFPDLMQIAPVEDVVRGYQAGGLFRPELWFFIQQDGIDVGTLLLTDAPPDHMELTYMGLIKPARRKGYAREIVRFAQSIACREKRSMLLTSADEKNIAACQSYLSQGFKAWDRKKVYARLFSG